MRSGQSNYGTAGNLRDCWLDGPAPNSIRYQIRGYSAETVPSISAMNWWLAKPDPVHPMTRTMYKVTRIGSHTVLPGPLITRRRGYRPLHVAPPDDIARRVCRLS